MSLEILSPGLLSTVQDLGRRGYQKEGIIVSGAMDAFALRTANLLVGNLDKAAGIEITLMGPQIRFTADHLISITGADLSPTVDGKPLKMWRPVRVPKGSTLSFGKPVRGCRAYLAVAGSFELPPVLGSLSTYLRAGLGGMAGRALQAGDVIPCQHPPEASGLIFPELGKSADTFKAATWSPDPALYAPQDEDPAVIRVIKGPEYELFSAKSREYLWGEKFQVTPQSDRMGYRLQGVKLRLAEEKELLSSAVSFGTVQVPAEGHPIVLMADHQTTGGYPRIAQVISADFSSMAQLVPGKKIRFREVTLEEAHQLYFEQEQKIEQIKRAIELKKWK